MLITCAACTTCTTGFCATYFGDGFTNDPFCVTSCDNYPITFYPVYCETDSYGNNCTETCCVRTTRSSGAIRNCTSTLIEMNTSAAYCVDNISNGIASGIIFGTLFGGILVIIIICCIYRACCEAKSAQ